MMDFPALTDFLAELAVNNNKPWFEEHRSTYEGLRGEWLDFVGLVIQGIAAFDPVVGVVSPKNAMFRINRDVRFSKDKRPYKTYFSAAISPSGRSTSLPVYYFHITEAAELLIAGGSYMPDPPTLAQIRKSVAEHPEKFAALLADPLFAGTFGTIDGERLKRPPQGYDESTPYIEYIKLKNWAAMVEPKGWLGRTEGLAGEIVETCRAVFPLVRWLREALSGSGEGEYLSPEDVDRLAESGL